MPEALTFELVAEIVSKTSQLGLYTIRTVQQRTSNEDYHNLFKPRLLPQVRKIERLKQALSEPTIRQRILQFDLVTIFEVLKHVHRLFFNYIQQTYRDSEEVRELLQATSADNAFDTSVDPLGLRPLEGSLMTPRKTKIEILVLVSEIEIWCGRLEFATWAESDTLQLKINDSERKEKSQRTLQLGSYFRRLLISTGREGPEREESETRSFRDGSDPHMHPVQLAPMKQYFSGNIPPRESVTKSRAHMLLAQGHIDQALGILWELADENSDDIGVLRELYVASREKYSIPVKSTFTAQWYALLVCQLSVLSRRSEAAGLGEVDWWPLATEDDLMMIKPRMEKCYYRCVLP